MRGRLDALRERVSVFSTQASCRPPLKYSARKMVSMSSPAMLTRYATTSTRPQITRHRYVVLLWTLAARTAPTHLHRKKRICRTELRTAKHCRRHLLQKGHMCHLIDDRPYRSRLRRGDGNGTRACDTSSAAYTRYHTRQPSRPLAGC